MEHWPRSQASTVGRAFCNNSSNKPYPSPTDTEERVNQRGAKNFKQYKQAVAAKA